MYSEIISAIESGNRDNVITVVHRFVGDNSGQPYAPIKYARDTWKCAEVRLQQACEREDSLGEVMAHAMALLGFLSPNLIKPTENNDKTDNIADAYVDTDGGTSTVEGGEPS